MHIKWEIFIKLLINLNLIIFIIYNFNFFQELLLFI